MNSKINTRTATIDCEFTEDETDLYSDFANANNINFSVRDIGGHLIGVKVHNIHYLVKWEILLLNIYRQNSYKRGISYWYPMWINISGDYYTSDKSRLQKPNSVLFDSVTENKYREYPVDDRRVTVDDETWFDEFGGDE